MIKGLDISSFQGNVNFDLLKPTVDFVICKATEGNGFKDPQITRNQSEARRVGLLLGYYHFARPDLGNTPQAEASWFLKTVGDLHAGEILCLDFEVTYSNGVNWCHDFLEAVYSMTKVRPLIYLNQSQVKAHDWTPVINPGYGLWLAEYDNNPDGTPVTTPWQVLALRQYSSEATFSGISGKVDGDVFYGDHDTFKKYGYQVTTTTTTLPMPPPTSGVIDDPPGQPEPVIHIGNNTKIDPAHDWSNMELQAIRSSLFDQEKGLIDARKEIADFPNQLKTLDDQLAKAQVDNNVLRAENDKLFKAINDPVSANNPTGGYVVQLKNAKLPTSRIAKLAMRLFG